MKLRIMSDLHLQLNKEYPLELKKDDVYTLIAGDIGPDFKENAEWIKRNVSKGALISGNHDAYTLDNVPLDDVKKYYHEMFPLENDITYLDDDVGVISKDIGENILLVGDVLYTDYSFPIYDDDNNLEIEKLRERNMRRASPKMSGSYMNDFFHFTRISDGDETHHYTDLPEGVFYLRPKVYLDHFNRVFQKITEIVEKNQDKKIVLMTHFCLSPKCMTENFSHESLNASYITDKEEWIKSHPNIKLIVSGHIHNRREFKIGDTLYVMNPLGYCKDGHHKGYTDNPDDDWTPDFFVDTDTWEVTRKRYNNKKWEKTYKKHMDKMLAWSGMFF